MMGYDTVQIGDFALHEIAMQELNKRIKAIKKELTEANSDLAFLEKELAAGNESMETLVWILIQNGRIMPTDRFHRELGASNLEKDIEGTSKETIHRYRLLLKRRVERLDSQ